MLTPFALREWDEIGSGILLKFARDGIEPRDRIVSSSYDVKERMTKGSMPATFLLKRGARLWWNSYIRTYLERDLRDLSSISNLADFHRLLEVIAYMGANLLEESTVARNIGISVPTAHRWINILETSLILYKLRPYLKGKISRIRKTPKVYFIDPALTFHLMKSEPTQKDWGRLFENLVFLQLLALTNSFGGELYYWRTLGGTEREVDFVWEYENRVIAVEAKFKEEVSIKDAQNLIYFCENNTCDGGFIAYSGNRVHKLLSNIWVVPIGEL